MWTWVLGIQLLFSLGVMGRYEMSNFGSWKDNSDIAERATRRRRDDSTPILRRNWRDVLNSLQDVLEAVINRIDQYHFNIVR